MRPVAGDARGVEVDVVRAEVEGFGVRPAPQLDDAALVAEDALDEENRELLQLLSVVVLSARDRCWSARRRCSISA